MATSEPLVPTGQPYGQRQETVAAMRQGGIPLTPPVSPQAGPQPDPTGSPQPGETPMDLMTLLSSTSPADFPFATEPDAVQPSSEPDSQIGALAASAQSSFGRAVLARLQSR